MVSLKVMASLKFKDILKDTPNLRVMANLKHMVNHKVTDSLKHIVSLKVMASLKLMVNHKVMPNLRVTASLKHMVNHKVMVSPRVIHKVTANPKDILSLKLMDNLMVILHNKCSMESSHKSFKLVEVNQFITKELKNHGSLDKLCLMSFQHAAIAITLILT